MKQPQGKRKKAKERRGPVASPLLSFAFLFFP
jgi:hypothetical protein